MKKYCYFFGLLLIHPLISAHYSSFTTSGKNSNYYSPPLKHKKHTQTPTLEFQTAPNKKYKRNITALLSLFWLCLLIRVYIIKKSLQIHNCQLESTVVTNVQNRGSL